jgi:hypothetical protein
VPLEGRKLRFCIHCEVKIGYGYPPPLSGGSTYIARQEEEGEEEKED